MRFMNPRVIVLFLVLSAQALCARDDTTVDLYAGWSWTPFSYYHHSPYYYGHHYPYWYPWPYAGAVFPLNGGDDVRRDPFYGHAGYIPAYAGFEYGVRLRLNNASPFPVPDGPLLPPPAGSAPLDLRDPLREEPWTREINALLGSLRQTDWPVSSMTNAPPQLNHPAE